MKNNSGNMPRKGWCGMSRKNSQARQPEVAWGRPLIGLTESTPDAPPRVTFSTLHQPWSNALLAENARHCIKCLQKQVKQAPDQQSVVELYVARLVEHATSIGCSRSVAVAVIGETVLAHYDALAGRQLNEVNEMLARLWSKEGD